MGAHSAAMYTWKMVVKGQLMLKMLRMRDTTLPADRELPPIWKKSASTLIGFCCSTCIAQNTFKSSNGRAAHLIPQTLEYDKLQTSCRDIRLHRRQQAMTCCSCPISLNQTDCCANSGLHTCFKDTRQA